LQVGLSDLIASSEDEYVRIATDLAKDPARLAHLKTSLRDKCLATVWCGFHLPLCHCRVRVSTPRPCPSSLGYPRV
jgi:hypothetical protein